MPLLAPEPDAGAPWRELLWLRLVSGGVIWPPVARGSAAHAS